MPVEEILSLEGRVARVTGASRGIGAAIAERLARAGADVVVGYGHDEEAAGRISTGISELGRRSVTVGGDVGDPSKLDDMVSAAERELGPIDILVSNAGIAPAQELEEITVEDWDHVMDVNLRPAFLLAKRLVSGMRERGWGRVVLVSSVPTIRPRRRPSSGSPAPWPALWRRTASRSTP